MHRLLYLFCFTFLWSCQGEEQNQKPIASDIPPVDSSSLPIDTPPKLPPTPDFDTLLWSELAQLDSSFIFDLKYASTDNFVKEQLYDCPRCFVRPNVGRALVKIQQELRKRQLGLKFFDCYRPLPIQQKLWDKVPNASYVTPPKKGSMHNRGRAVDVTLVSDEGLELDLGTPFDFFGPRAHHTYTALPDSIVQRRQLLKNIMEANGFRSIRTEWWHYSHLRGGYSLADWLWPCED